MQSALAGVAEKAVSRLTCAVLPISGAGGREGGREERKGKGGRKESINEPVLNWGVCMT